MTAVGWIQQNALFSLNEAIVVIDGGKGNNSNRFVLTYFFFYGGFIMNERSWCCSLGIVRRNDNVTKVATSFFPDKVCNRPWTFERVPNMELKDHNDAQIFVSSKEYCMAACLNEVRGDCVCNIYFKGTHTITQMKVCI